MTDLLLVNCSNLPQRIVFLSMRPADGSLRITQVMFSAAPLVQPTATLPHVAVSSPSPILAAHKSGCSTMPITNTEILCASVTKIHEVQVESTLALLPFLFLSQLVSNQSLLLLHNQLPPLLHQFLFLALEQPSVPTPTQRNSTFKADRVSLLASPTLNAVETMPASAAQWTHASAIPSLSWTPQAVSQLPKHKADVRLQTTKTPKFWKVCCLLLCDLQDTLKFIE